MNQPVQPKVDPRLAEGIVELANLDREIEQDAIALEEKRDLYARNKYRLFQLGYDIVRILPKAPTVIVGTRQSGTIKKVVTDKGYGFIAGSDSFDYFVHLSDLRNIQFQELVEGMPCTFSIKTPHTALKAGAAHDVNVTDLDYHPSNR